LPNGTDYPADRLRHKRDIMKENILPGNWIWKDTNSGALIAPEKISEILSRIEMAFWKLDMKIKEII
jgi:hypothetical protein